MIVREIPLGPIPARFTVDLGGRPFSMRTQYRDAVEGGWFLDLYDGNTRAPILMGVPMVTRVNLWGPYAYLDLPGYLFVISHDGKDMPAFEDLGTSARLLHAMD